jgi:hypothetical protein
MTTNQVSLRTILAAGRDQVSADLSSGESDTVVILGLRDGEYFELSDVGARIWHLFQEPHSVESVRDKLLSEYDVEPSVCEQDLLRLAADLVDRGLVVVVNEPNP